jgi:hypothetical protein
LVQLDRPVLLREALGERVLNVRACPLTHLCHELGAVVISVSDDEAALRIERE